MTGFAHISISADNLLHFLLVNKMTQFKIALTQIWYCSGQDMAGNDIVKELAASRHHWITDQELISING